MELLCASVYRPKRQTQLLPGSRLLEDGLLLHNPVLPGLKFLPLSISKFGPAQTLDPVSCPPPPLPAPLVLDARGAAIDGGPPLDPPEAAQRGNPLPPLTGWKLQNVSFGIFWLPRCRMF